MGIPEEALALAFLSVGSIQLSYAYRPIPVATRLSNPSSVVVSATSQENHKRYATISKELDAASLSLVRASITLMSTSTAKEETVETLSETCSLLTMNRLFMGGSGYEESLGVWNELVGVAGEPLHMCE